MPHGIIVCDGGSAILRRIGGPYGITTDQIIERFLELNQSIAFVMTLTVQGSQKVTERLYEGEYFSALGQQTVKVLRQLKSHLPVADRTAINALNHLKLQRPHEGVGFLGGSSVREKEIKISSRALLALLSGRLTQNQFLDLHRWTAWNPIANELAKGHLVTSITVEKTDQDDDWLSFKFGDPDPAISAFSVPNS